MTDKLTKSNASLQSAEISIDGLETRAGFELLGTDDKCLWIAYNSVFNEIDKGIVKAKQSLLDFYSLPQTETIGEYSATEATLAGKVVMMQSVKEKFILEFRAKLAQHHLDACVNSQKCPKCHSNLSDKANKVNVCGADVCRGCIKIMIAKISKKFGKK